MVSTTRDEITTKIIELLRKNPHQSARDIARKIGILRKDANSRLYSHVDEIFGKEGTDPPLWRLIDQHAINSGTSSSSVSTAHSMPSEVMSRSGLESRRHLNDQELTSLAAKLLGSNEILFRANGINIEVSLAERSLSDPYFAFEMVDGELMQVVINTTAIPNALLRDKEYLFGHLVHCVADAFVFRVVEKMVSPMDRDDLYQYKNQILLQLGFDPGKDPFE
jgi:hypothetical protein